MKTIRTPRVVLGFVVLLLLAGTLFLVTGNSRVRAALGNTGVPVRCFKPGAALAPGASTFLSCVPASGPAFADGQRVPNGYYLLVMDVLVSPDAGVEDSSRTDVTIYDAYGDNSRQSSFRLRNTVADSYGFKFSAPYLVLSPGHRLEITNAAASEAGVEVRITGLLVTNVSFVPLAVGD
jgi:hypothetical protein